MHCKLFSGLPHWATLPPWWWPCIPSVQPKLDNGCQNSLPKHPARDLLPVQPHYLRNRGECFSCGTFNEVQAFKCSVKKTIFDLQRTEEALRMFTHPEHRPHDVPAEMLGTRPNNQENRHWTATDHQENKSHILQTHCAACKTNTHSVARVKAVTLKMAQTSECVCLYLCWVIKLEVWMSNTLTVPELEPQAKRGRMGWNATEQGLSSSSSETKS